MGRCVLDVIDAINSASGATFEVIGVLDDANTNDELLATRGVSRLGPTATLESLPAGVGYVIGIGSGQVRRRIDQFADRQRRPSPTLVHPNVHRGFDVRIGPGSVICSHVSLENNIGLGRHVHVNQNSTIGHDSRLADYVTVSPLVAVSGATNLEEAAFIGTGASIRQGVTVGGDGVVGMGSAVLRDVARGTRVMGVPATER